MEKQSMIKEQKVEKTKKVKNHKLILTIGIIAWILAISYSYHYGIMFAMLVLFLPILIVYAISN